MGLNTQDRVLLGATFATAVVGIALMVIGFILRFGRGFGTFVTYAQKDDDFLELKRLDMIFGLFIAAAGILVLTFFLAAIATIRQNRFLFWMYCAIIALMIVVQLIAGLLSFNYADQINQLASDDVLYESLDKVIVRMQGSSSVTSDDESQFWSHTQNTLNCCGVFNMTDWKRPPGLSDAQILALNCFVKNSLKGCEKEMRSRINTDAQYLGAASMGVLVVEIIACFMSGYKAYTLGHPEQYSM